MGAFLALAVPFLKTWWKVILPVVLLLLAISYVGVLHLEINHYKDKVIALEKEKAIVQEKNNLLEHNATEISKKYARQLENRLLEEQKKSKLVQERIKKDEESKRIPLSSNVVSLFNASKPDAQPASTTERKDVGEASPNRETSLNALLEVSARNDAAHQTCIETVAEWQAFWKDYSEGVKAIGGSQ